MERRIGNVTARPLGRFLFAAAVLLNALLIPALIHAQNPPVATTGPNLPNLTGTYSADDGGVYYIQQSGNVLWWAGLSLDNGVSADRVWHRGLGFTNVFRGTYTNATTITGEWADVSRGATLNSGTMTLTVDTSGAAPKLSKSAATGGFGATTWNQTGPLDDTKFNGSTLDIISTVDLIHKRNAD